MIKTIAIAVAVVVVTILIYAATRPDTLQVERSIAIKVSPEKLFGLINDFRQWDAWTPYNKDPAMKKTYSDKTSGKGARYAWEGNKEVGKGEITITESEPNSRIAFDLHMIAPFEGRNHVVFALKPEGNFTTVTWMLEDKQSYFVKLMCVFINMDKMIGNDFEIGLARLKSIAEK